MDYDERWMLGKIILDAATLKKPAFQSLRVADFQDDRNALVFWAAKKISQRGEKVTMTGIRQELAAASILEFIGGDNFLCEFSAAIIAEHGWL